MRKIRDPQSEIPLPGFEVFHDEFPATRKEEMVILKAALASLDFKTLAGYAHKWKGFASPYGFQELESSAKSLEKSALNSERDQCADLLREIDAYFGS